MIDLKFSEDQNRLQLTLREKVIAEFKFVESNALMACEECAFFKMCPEDTVMRCDAGRRCDKKSGYWVTIEEEV